MKLYTFFRSSASYRVRIAMNLKGLPYEPELIHLSKDGGGQNQPAFRQLNPQGLLPVLIDDDGHTLTQSLAILEYLEELHPETPLLPPDALGRAQVRSIALAISCDIHPINNLRVLQYLGGTLGQNEEQRNTWYRHWTESGLNALETMLVQSGKAGKFCHGDTPTLADCCLVPQMFNAKRFECDLSKIPTLVRINDACLQLEAFAKASPPQQPDAQ
ncbi:maleylacetoacetate isomerase [Oxalobacteraceae bacterium CAVE-383]|nr:maleylacetoacetate isomerase [Oxalobacteraceae bacterium CAVE-383]